MAGLARDPYIDGAGDYGAPSILESVSPELQADREIVLASVYPAPQTLRFAAPELRADREIILTALSSPFLLDDDPLPEDNPMDYYDETALQYANEADRLEFRNKTQQQLYELLILERQRRQRAQGAKRQRQREQGAERQRQRPRYSEDLQGGGLSLIHI